jgi:hypothetical protein
MGLYRRPERKTLCSGEQRVLWLYLFVAVAEAMVAEGLPQFLDILLHGVATDAEGCGDIAPAVVDLFQVDG